MAQRLQVFSITHLPQVAARGVQHYKVFKQDDGLSTQTHMLLIDQEQRVLEIAEMLGGRPVAESAVAHAKQLLLR
jgi:DNA repair protein RecN (Recombination protein N)